MAENPGCSYWAEHIRFDDIVAYGAVLATFNLLTALLCAWGLRLLVKQERLGLNMQTCATLLVMAASLLAFIIHTVNPVSLSLACLLSRLSGAWAGLRVAAAALCSRPWLHCSPSARVCEAASGWLTSRSLCNSTRLATRSLRPGI
jgi:hypothetical protein